MARLTKEERKLIEVVPVRWRGLVDKLVQDQRANSVSDVISSEAVRLVRLAAYIECRCNYPTLGHEGAVKASNKAVKVVRKALGYAFPKDDLMF